MSLNHIDILNKLLDQKVIVKYIDNIEFEGILRSIDGYLNVVLENVSVKFMKNHIDTLNHCFIRGIHIKHIYIS